MGLKRRKRAEIPSGGVAGKRSKKKPAGKRGKKKPVIAAARAATPSPRKKRRIHIAPLRTTIRREIIKALDATSSLREAAKALQMPYSSFRDKLDQYGIVVPGRELREHRSPPAFSLKSELGGG